MAEPEPPRQPESDQPPTGSWTPAPPFDLAAVQGTAPYPFGPTASLPGTPDTAATATNHPGREAETVSSDLPQIPGYRVLRVVGGGGMGTVFKAVHLATDRTVALKLINSGWAAQTDFRLRFAREAKTLAALEHPNVVPIYDAGNWQGLPFLTMKFIAGKTLYHHQEAISRDPCGAAKLLATIARAVHYLHTNNIIHRDLKPLNILLTEDGTPLVADFGLVRPLDDDSELSMTLIPLGTRQYMSPEQTLGGRENYTTACDIWALGVILYELLAGHRPFAHDDSVELVRQIRNDPLPPIPAERNASRWLEAIARKCLAKAPADRYATAEEIAVDLERWLAGEVTDTDAPLPTEPAPAGKPARRRLRWLVALGLLALLGFSKLPPQPVREDAPPPPTVAERLQRGETAWLVGPKGLPHVPTRTLPGTHGTATTEIDGYLTLNSAGSLLLEFDTGPLPPSYRFEADIALAVANENWSWGGLFAGRKETPSQDGPQQTAIQLIQQNAFALNGETETVTEKATFELFRWTGGGPQSRTERGSKKHVTELPANRKADLTWQPFTVLVTPGQLAGRWRDQQVAFFAADPALKLLNNTFNNEKRGLIPPFQIPVFGTGLGLSVKNATVAVRNVRIVP